jgi:hypothetical protein
MILSSKKFHYSDKNYRKYDTETIIVSKKIIINIIKKAKKYIWIRLGSVNYKNINTDIDIFSKLLPHVKKPLILITGDGDRSVFKDIKKETSLSILKSNKIVKWFTQNYDGTIKHHKIINYPIGLDLHSNRGSQLRSYYQILRYFKKSRNFDKKRKFKIFCDVHLTQNTKFNNPRALLFKILKKCNHIYFLKKKTNFKKIVQYYSKYTFVVSTHGNGLDCHRTWEALYLGAMVITKKSSLDSLYINLPVIIIDTWDCLLDINFLRKEYDRLKPLLKKEYIEKCFEQNYWL